MSFRAVACFPPAGDREAGYATPAALVLSLALALMGSAMVTRSVLLLRMTKADLERSQVEYALAGAQLEAAASVVRAGTTGPFHWTSSTDLGWVDLLAEREADKLSLAAAAELPAAALAQFEVADPAALQARLAAAAEAEAVADVGAMDASPLWRQCGPRLVSSFGGQTRLTFAADSEPEAGTKPAWWRIGEAWRIRVASAQGWRDDRIVRFTGDALHPVAVVARRLSRGEVEGGRCEDLLRALAAA